MSFFSKGVCLFCLGLLACGKEATKSIPFETMKTLVWDMMNASNKSELFDSKRSLDSATIPMQQVLYQYQVSKQRFFYNLKQYEENPVKLKLLFDSAEAYGQARKIKSELQ